MTVGNRREGPIAGIAKFTAHSTDLLRSLLLEHVCSAWFWSHCSAADCCQCIPIDQQILVSSRMSVCIVEYTIQVVTSMA